ncbi:MAG: hypothetical protein ABIZ95_17870 [Pyrinomonadaceae bacterium]
MQNYQVTGDSLPARRTSKLGKISFMIAPAIFLLVLASFGLLILFGLSESKSTETIFVISVFGWLIAPLGHFVGMVLGIIDVCRKRSKKLIPSLGIVGNAILGGIGIAIMFLVVSILGPGLTAFR